MTIPQTSYSENMDRGLEGQWSDAGSDNHARSQVNTAADMSFGRGVMRGASDDLVTLPTATIADFCGITLRSHSGSGDTTETGIPQYTPANIARKGRIKVIAEEAFTKGSQVHLRFQNAGALPEAIGRFRATADGADTVRLDDVFPIRWASSGAAGDVGILEINLP